MEIEAIFGVTALTVRRWIDQGCPASKSGRVWKVNTADLFGFVRALDSGRQVDPSHDLDARLAAAKVTQAEIAAAEASGTVIEIARVEQAMGEVMSTARTRLLGIAPAVAVECAAAQTAGECREIISAQVVRTCEDIANALQVIGKR
jgi:phage terminase Nu1 subunit (DNA packaging protein)